MTFSGRRDGSRQTAWIHNSTALCVFASFVTVVHNQQTQPAQLSQYVRPLTSCVRHNYIPARSTGRQLSL